MAEDAGALRDAVEERGELSGEAGELEGGEAGSGVVPTELGGALPGIDVGVALAGRDFRGTGLIGPGADVADLPIDGAGSAGAPDEHAPLRRCEVASELDGAWEEGGARDAGGEGGRGGESPEGGTDCGLDGGEGLDFEGGLDDHTGGAKAADVELVQVVTDDILDDTTAALDEVALRRGHANSEDKVTGGAVEEA